MVILEIFDWDQLQSLINVRLASHVSFELVKTITFYTPGVGILSTLGGFLTYPEPSVIIDRNKMITKEPQML
jgi:hypothetical protein